MTKEQVKPLIEIEFTDEAGEKTLEYVCDFYHLISNAKGPNAPTNITTKLKEARDKIIQDKNIEDGETYIDLSIDSARENFAKNLSDINRDKNSENYENYVENVKQFDHTWKIKVLNFNKHTILRDITEYGNETTFTSKGFKYIGNRKEFEISGEEIHISKVGGSEFLQTINVEWEPYETVGTVISRARRQYEAVRS